MPHPKDATIFTSFVVTCINLTTLDEKQECREKCVAPNVAGGAHFESSFCFELHTKQAY